MNPLSGVLSEAWELYKRHAWHFIAIAFAIYLVAAVISALLSLAAAVWGDIIGLVFTLLAMFLLQAALVKAVQDVRDGRADLDLAGTLSAAFPFVGKVALASILASIGIAIGFVFLILPGLILLTYWSLLVPWIVIGGSGALAAFGRSWRTVSGYGLVVFGTFVLLFLIMIAVQLVLSLILLALPIAARSFIADVVAGTLVAPYIAATVTLIYYRLIAVHGESPEPGATGDGQPLSSGTGTWAGVKRWGASCCYLFSTGTVEIAVRNAAQGRWPGDNTGLPVHNQAGRHRYRRRFWVRVHPVRQMSGPVDNRRQPGLVSR